MLPSQIPRWRTVTGSSFNINVISAAAAVFQGTSDPLPPAPASCDIRKHHVQPEVETVPKTGSTNNLRIFQSKTAPKIKVKHYMESFSAVHYRYLDVDRLEQHHFVVDEDTDD